MLDPQQAQSLPKALPREVRSLAILTTTGAGGRSGGCERRPASLLKNSAATGKHWLRLHLVGKKSNPNAIGARMSWPAGDLKRSWLKISRGSYLSSHDPRKVF